LVSVLRHISYVRFAGHFFRLSVNKSATPTRSTLANFSSPATDGAFTPRESNLSLIGTQHFRLRFGLSTLTASLTDGPRFRETTGP
jgi:hypothetical protein